MTINAQEFAKQLLKAQGLQNAVKIATDSLKISTEAMSKEVTPFADEIMLSMGDSKKQKVTVNMKKHNKRLSKNLNFWKEVSALVKKQVK